MGTLYYSIQAVRPFALSRSIRFTPAKESWLLTLASNCLRIIVACRCRVHSTQGFHIDKIELWTLKARHLVNWVKCQRFDNKAIQWLQSKSVGWQNWICNSIPNPIWHCQPRAEISLSAKDQWHSGDLSLFLYSRICKKTDWWRGSVVKTTN